MYNFKQHLEDDEKILYEGQATPGKGEKSVGGLIFVIGFMLCLQIAMIGAVVSKTGDGAKGIDSDFIFLFLITLAFEGIAVYALIYNFFIKKKAVADDYYCLTNKRAFKYETKKDKLVFGYLVNYEEIEVLNEKENYGDLRMMMVVQENECKQMDINDIKELIFNPNPEDMPCITFEAIENPYIVLALAQKAREEILKNTEI